MLAVVIVVGARTLKSYSGSSGGSVAAPVPVPPVANLCSRPVAGSVVQNPPALFSHAGILTVNFSYQTTTVGLSASGISGRL
jgi:hypothetical protein